MTKSPYPDYLLAGSLLVLICWLGYFTQQSEFIKILPALLLYFGVWYWVYKRVDTEKSIYFFILVGVLLRLSLLPAFPNWSDDIYRFLWDGYLWNAGINPFDQLPVYYLEKDQSIPGINPELFSELNSPEYFTIYPPVCQAIFAFATSLFPSSWYAATIVMKSIVVGMEVGSLYLLVSLLKSGYFSHLSSLKPVLLYALNPLIILEISGNLHFEGAMVFFLLLALWLLYQGKNNYSALAWSLSIASKLLPLLFLPLLIRRLGWGKSIIYFALIGICCLLLFFPIMSADFIQNFGESLDLYFRKFEFNASLYYLIRWVGYHTAGYNIIQYAGPLLGVLVFLVIWGYTLWEKNPEWKNLPGSLLFVITIYLLFAMTIHPWYLTLPLVFCLFTDYRFPVIWSGLILLTYINYSYDSYWESLWIVGLEYGIVGAYFYWEWKNMKSVPNSAP